jgi:signal transduction histidine kinase
MGFLTLKLHMIDPAICSWDTSAFLLMFSDNVSENFVYYSHLLPALSTLIFAGVLLKQDFSNKLSKILSFIVLAFAGWCLSDLILWADANPDHIMFFWSILIYFEILVYIGSLYFINYFINKKPLDWRIELAIFIITIPVFLFAHTSLNLAAFDYTNCLKEAIEGPLVLYAYLIEILLTLGILIIAAMGIMKSGSSKIKIEITLVSIGMLLFLFAFSFGNIFGSIDTNYELGQFGLLAAPVFMGLLAYISVKFGTFHLKSIGAEILIVTIILLIVSILFNTKVEHIRVIAGFTAFVTGILGYMLIKGVKREIAQKEEIEKLATSLQTANEKLKVLDKMKSEFVSIASHQLRSPLTSIRGYSSMLAEGSYGKLTAKGQEVVERISESAKYMALSVEDYLNVSRIEAGNMKYEMSDFNLKEVAEKLTDELRPVALKKGLVMVFRSDCDGSCSVRADIGKTRQVIMNIIDNSMKYTPKGTITVIAHDDAKKKKMYVTINDTGVGMSKETQEEVFEKFVRAKNANNVNVTGTGLGLYVAKKMITDMGGRVWAESEGEGQGSSFHIELPLLAGKATGR